MDNAKSAFHHDELSEEDLEVLRAFHVMEEPAPDDASSGETMQLSSLSHQSIMPQSSTTVTEDDMLVIFTTEADEGIAAMRLALQQLEQDDGLDSSGLKALKRMAHKMAGTAAAIGCDSMSVVAHYMETIIKMMEDDTVVYLTGLIALVHAVRALESTLQSIATLGYESKNPLLELEEEYRALSIDVEAVQSTQAAYAVYTSKSSSSDSAGDTLLRVVSRDRLDTLLSPPSIRIDLQHINKLLEHTEKLIELDTPLENAQKRVEAALNELHTAQARLRRLEPLLSSLSTTADMMVAGAGNASSSLLTRILYETVHGTGHMQLATANTLLQPALIQDSALWDDMEIDRFTETNVLAHSLTEAITDVATATSQLRQALAHLNTIVGQQVNQANVVHNDALLLRSAPFSNLVARLKQAIKEIVGAQKENVQFEASGETIEIDQDMLEMLADPLLKLVQSSVAEGLFFAKKSGSDDEQRLRIWLNAHAVGNEVTIEIGFSAPVSPGSATELYETVYRLYGSISLQEHSGEEMGMTLYLRFPRSQRIIQGLLVRVDSQCIIVPVSQVQHIHYNNQRTGKAYSQHVYQGMPFAEWYHLSTLLGFVTENHFTEKTIRPALVLQLDGPQIAVEVDEIIGEVELVMKPLAAHLCRPGITSTAIDGSGNVLLVVNLPAMIKLRKTHQHAGVIAMGAGTLNQQEASTPAPQVVGLVRRKILVADDSVYMRRSLNLTLDHEGYDVLEAEDGIQTLEQLANESPDLLLLDIEMPHLNGYDVLNIIRPQRRFAPLKIVLLTSRSSEKHKRRGKELGAHAYLTKPCPQDVLLETIRSLLADESSPSSM